MNGVRIKQNTSRGFLFTFTGFFVCFLFLSHTAFAEDFFVAYAEGEITVREGNSWGEVHIGDTLTLEDTIRLGKASVAELSSSRDLITLTREGTYSLEKMVKEADQRKKVRFGALLTGKLETALKGTKHKEQSAVGGVRGSEAVEDEGMSWMTSDTTALIGTGKEELAKGDVDAALSLFQEAYDYALDDQEMGMAAFYLAGCYDLKGEKDKALSLLEDVKLKPDSALYTDFHVLKGKLLVETFAYAEAETFLARFQFSQADEEASQLLYLLLGLSCLGQEKNSPARDYFTKAKNIDPSSDTGKAAAELMQSL